MASVWEPSGLLCVWANSERRCPTPHSLLQGHGPRCSERPEWDRGDVPCTGTWGTDRHRRFCTANKGSSQRAHTPLADSRTIVSLLFRLRGCQPGWESGGHGGLWGCCPQALHLQIGPRSQEEQGLQEAEPDTVRVSAMRRAPNGDTCRGFEHRPLLNESGCCGSVCAGAAPGILSGCHG